MSRLVLVHGFTQTGASWTPLVPALERAGHLVCTPDVPAALGLVDGAAALADSAGVGVWIGYSMGGRLALHVALAFPDQVERLVLVSATAGIDDPMDRAVRREEDELRAQSAEASPAEFLRRWLAQPLFAGLSEDAAGLDTRETSGPVLASHLRLMGTGRQEPLWDRVGELEMPVLIVAGERDRKFVQLGQRITTSIGDNAEMLVIPDSGHACHLERPHEFLDAMLPFV